MTDVRNMRKLIESVNGMSDADMIREYSENDDVVEELEYIQEQMLDLLSQAEGLVRGTSEASSAQAYWLAHIETALSNDHGYLGGSMTTMQDTIDALRNDVDADDEGYDEDGYDEDGDHRDDKFDDPNPRGRG